MTYLAYETVQRPRTEPVKETFVSVHAYVKGLKALGCSQKEIRESLMRAGWSRNDGAPKL